MLHAVYVSLYIPYPVQVHQCTSTASCPWQCHASGGQGSRQCQPQDILPLLHSWRRIRSASVPNCCVPISRGMYVCVLGGIIDFGDQGGKHKFLCPETQFMVVCKCNYTRLKCRLSLIPLSSWLAVIQSLIPCL